MVLYNGRMNRALFLDRDGVIIENCDHYVRSWDDVVFLPQALHALRLLRSTPLKIILVTNQSAVGRGIITLQTALEIHSAILEQVSAAGGRVDDTFICPHAPQENCDCRKPKPGLLLQARERYSLDLSSSIFIGDAVSDLQAAENAGIGVRILVRTGRGENQLHLPEADRLRPFLVFDTLFDAVAHFPPNLIGE